MDSIYSKQPDLPAALPHRELAKAIFGASVQTVEEQDWRDFFTMSNTPEPNPWIHSEKPQYDDEEFIDYSTPIAKLFRPELQAAASTAIAFQQFTTSEPKNEPEAQDIVLSKRASTERRKAAIREHVQRQLAIGETIESLAKFARQHDLETALLIEEIGAELCA